MPRQAGHHPRPQRRRCSLSRAPWTAESVERWTETLAATTGFAEVERTLELTSICSPCWGDAIARVAGMPVLRNDCHIDAIRSWF